MAILVKSLESNQQYVLTLEGELSELRNHTTEVLRLSEGFPSAAHRARSDGGAAANAPSECKDGSDAAFVKHLQVGRHTGPLCDWL